MTKIKCYNCGTDVIIDVSKAVDEDGETFRCPHCGSTFRYAEK